MTLCLISADTSTSLTNQYRRLCASFLLIHLPPYLSSTSLCASFLLIHLPPYLSSTSLCASFQLIHLPPFRTYQYMPLCASFPADIIYFPNLPVCDCELIPADTSTCTSLTYQYMRLCASSLLIHPPPCLVNLPSSVNMKHHY